MATYISVTPSFNVPGLPVVRKTVSSAGSHITKQLWGERTKWRWLLLWRESYLSPYGMSCMTGQIMSTSNQIVKSPQTTDDHDIPSLIRLLSLWWVRPRLQINFMSWEAMEVSMSKTRRGKYTESDICVFTQVQYVVCLPIRFFTYSSNCSYPMRGKSFSFYRGKVIKKTKQPNFIRNNLSQKVINETFQIH